MNHLNRRLAPGVETMYVMSSPEFAFVSSSGVKEIASFGGNVEGLVTSVVARRFHRELPDSRRGRLSARKGSKRGGIHGSATSPSFRLRAGTSSAWPPGRRRPPAATVRCFLDRSRRRPPGRGTFVYAKRRPEAPLSSQDGHAAEHPRSADASTIPGMDVLVLIDKLDDLVHNAKAVPLTDQVRIDREEIYDILDQMRATIPEEIKQARWIVKERQEMLAEAKREVRPPHRRGARASGP